MDMKYFKVIEITEYDTIKLDNQYNINGFVGNIVKIEDLDLGVDYIDYMIDNTVDIETIKPFFKLRTEKLLLNQYVELKTSKHFNYLINDLERGILNSRVILNGVNISTYYPELKYKHNFLYKLKRKIKLWAQK